MNREQDEARQAEIEQYGKDMAKVARLLKKAYRLASKHSTAGDMDWVSGNIADALEESRRRAGDYL